LGVLWKNQGRLDEAEKLLKQALKGKEELLGMEHMSTLITVDNLGILYKNQGRLSDAEEMHARALGSKEKTLGPDHPSTLETVQNLGVLYKNQRRRNESEAMYLRALEGKKRNLGPNHPSTLDTVQNLGILYTKQEDRLDDAERCLVEALQGFTNIWGPVHLSTLSVCDNLGIVYRKKGLLGKAEGMLSRALQGYEQASGAEVADTYVPVLNTLEDLGDLKSELGNLPEALRHYQRAQAGLEKVLGVSSDRYATITSKLVSLERTWREADQPEV
jgi:tetratricopeptide (TPR) repeat protein